MRRVCVNGVSLSWTGYSPNDVQPVHSHENPNLFFLMSGEFRDESEALGSSVLPRFGVVVHPAGAPHASYAGPVGRAGVNIEFGKTWLFENEVDLTRYQVIPQGRTTLNLLRLALQGGDFEGCLLDVVANLSAGGTEKKEKSQWLARVSKLIQDHPGHWTLSGLAAEVNVHPVYLARVFRRHYGQSISEYCNHQRLLQASNALMAGGRAIGEIAIECGFSDHAHLSRNFRAVFGVAPRSLAAIGKEFQSFKTL